MSTGHRLTDELVKKIKTSIRLARSARHAPAKVRSLPFDPRPSPLPFVRPPFHVRYGSLIPRYCKSATYQ
jgi:hypothetical protein